VGGYLSSEVKCLGPFANLFALHRYLLRLSTHPRLAHGAHPPPSDSFGDDEDEEDEEGGLHGLEMCDQPATELVTGSVKMALLRALLTACVRRGEKVLVFSQCLASLSAVQLLLEDANNAAAATTGRPLGRARGNC
jgi:hypothetical protein